jgi:LacI family transcriptional regulator
VDALFSASDQMALGAMHVANARGIRIPEQLAVVGFDGIPEAAEFTPSLTTIRQPLQEIGRLAVQELVASFVTETGPVARTITLPTELVLGDSAPMPMVAGPAGATGAGATGAGATGASATRPVRRESRSVPAAT